MLPKLERTEHQFHGLLDTLEHGWYPTVVDHNYGTPSTTWVEFDVEEWRDGLEMCGMHDLLEEGWYVRSIEQKGDDWYRVWFNRVEIVEHDRL